MATTTKTVTIKLNAARLDALLGTRLDSMAEGDHYAGMVWSPRKESEAAFKKIKAEVAALDQKAEAVTLKLTKHEAGVLFYAVVVTGASAYATANVITEKNFPVIAALVTAGFGYPKVKDVY